MVGCARHWDPRGADVAIEIAGKQKTLDLAGRIVTVRGRLVMVGYHQGGPRSVDMQDWNFKGLDVINAHARDPQVYFHGMQAGIRLLAEGRLRMEPLVTHCCLLKLECCGFGRNREAPKWQAISRTQYVGASLGEAPALQARPTLTRA